jgi:hypothetical protein
MFLGLSFQRSYRICLCHYRRFVWVLVFQECVHLLARLPQFASQFLVLSL